MSDKLYGDLTEEKWKDRLYRAWRWSATPTETLWEMFKPLLEQQHKQLVSLACKECYAVIGHEDKCTFSEPSKTSGVKDET